MKTVSGQSIYAGFLATTAICCLWILSNETETPVSAQDAPGGSSQVEARAKSIKKAEKKPYSTTASLSEKSPQSGWSLKHSASGEGEAMTPPALAALPEGANPSAANDVERRAQAFALGETDQKLKEAFGDDDVGRRLFTGFLATRHMAEIAGGEASLDALHEQYTQWFRSNPDQVKTAIERVLPKLDAEEFGPERAAILGILSTLPNQQSAARDMAAKEFTENIVAPARGEVTSQSAPEELEAYYSASTRHYVAIAAHQTFLDTQPPFEEALGKTVEGLRAQPDRNVQLSIARQLIQRYPTSQAQIIKDFKAAGLEFRDADLAP